MTPTDRELLTDLLHACYDAAPEPLYPARFAEGHGIDRSTLDHALDDLRLRGLVRLTDWAQGLGQGYTLTQAGLDLIENPRGLRPGAPLPKPQPAPVRDPYEEPHRDRPLMVIRPTRPVMSWTLIISNIVIFFLSEPQLAPYPRLARWLQNNGVLISPLVLQEHQWWRLLSYAFLHAGMMHIFFNMYFFYSLGPLIEALWGSARLLLLYVVGAITGGCVIVWVDRVTANGLPIPTVGASGALCGLLASVGVWVMLNRHNLPPALAAALSRNVTINLVLIGILSFIPGVSWEGHLGGALGGALASFPLQWSRYGERWWQRVLGFAGTVLIAAFFVALMFARGWGMRPQF
jgi:membrane associated rhomboid family serine protease